MASADRVYCVTLDEGTGDLELEASPFSPKWFLPPASLNGELVDYAVVHRTQNQVETGTCIYDHPTLTLLRSTGQAWRSTAGELTKETFAPGVKDVLIGYSSASLNQLQASQVKTADYVMAIGDPILSTDTTGGTFQVTLPPGASDGYLACLEDAAPGGSWSEATPLLVVTSDGTTLDGFDGAEGVNHDDGTRVLWRLRGTNWIYLDAPAATGASGGGGGGGVATGGLRSITAPGFVPILAADVGQTVEFVASTGQQVGLLPPLADCDPGNEIGILCALDDSVSTAWPVLVEASVPGQLETQPQIGGWNPTTARVQMGKTNSRGARATALHAGTRWVLTGDFSEPTLALAPDEIADLEWWHEAEPSTLTFSSGANLQTWASKGGSIGGSLARISAASAVAVGTAGTPGYAVEFDYTSAAKYYEVTRAGQATGNCSFLLIVQHAASAAAGGTIWQHNPASGFGNQPSFQFSTVAGRIQAITLGASTINADNLGHATIPSAMVVVYAAPLFYAYVLRPDGVEQRPSVPMSGTILASSVSRLGSTTNLARVFRVMSLARYARVLSATEVGGLLAWARATRNIP